MATERNAHGQYLPGSNSDRTGTPNANSYAVRQQFWDTLADLNAADARGNWVRTFAEEHPRAFADILSRTFPKESHETHEHFIKDGREQPEIVRLLDNMRGSLLLPVIEAEAVENVDELQPNRPAD